mmetsp:Transcript_52396/g.136452  ORF Transcript_52396/g.136452 Transcript_52396/m.136452 type:complete len:385 (+) Transcript_52396:3-1157(+)
MRHLTLAAALIHLLTQPWLGQAALAVRFRETAEEAPQLEVEDGQRRFGLKRPGQVTPWLGRKGTALVVLSHWIPGAGKNGSEHAREKVEKSLNRTLGEIHSWFVESTIVLVTNEYNENISSVVSQQVVTGNEPWCNATFQFKFCMPWEALKALRNASATWTPGCDLNREAACGMPQYDYYVYSESDIKAPRDTFEFWATHADSLHRRGYLLLPHRQEHFGNNQVLTDCYDEDCWNRTAVYIDYEGEDKLYSSPLDRMYVLPGNPYAGCFFMTSTMYNEWLESTMWDYSAAMLLSHPPVGNIKSWGKRESATGGLLWDPRYGAARGLTHLKMSVFHASHMHRVTFTENDYRKVVDVIALVENCANGSLHKSRCKPLPDTTLRSQL